MKRLTIIETRNGVIVVYGEATRMETPGELAARSWSFDSLNKAIAQIRLILKQWRAEEKG